MPTDDDGPLFAFSLKAAADAKGDIELRLAALDHRMQKLMAAAELGGVRIIPHLLHLSDDPDELDRLGKSLSRIAEIMPLYRQLKRKQDALELANEEPTFFAYAFGEFAAEIDADTTRFERGDTRGFGNL